MKFLADGNFNNDILRGVWRRIPDASFTRVQDTEVAGADDPPCVGICPEIRMPPTCNHSKLAGLGLKFLLHHKKKANKPENTTANH